MKAVLGGTLLLTAVRLLAASGPIGPGSGLLERATPIDASVALERIEPQRTPEGRFLVLAAEHPGAAAVRVHFSRMHIPESGALYIYGLKDGSVVDQQGPLGADGTGAFWSQPVRGRVYIELQFGREAPALLPFRIDQVEAVDARTMPAAAASGIAQPDVFEGDILISGMEAVGVRSRMGRDGKARASIGITGTEYRWPGGILPYEVEGSMPDAYRVTAAVDHWNRLLDGVVRIVQRTNEPNYVAFKRSSDPGRCASWVGMVGNGPQAIEVGDYCATGNMIHEIGHAFGLWHEQSRGDREGHIRILWENIAAGLTVNFQQMTGIGDDLGEYDFASIMHYNAYAFSANGMPTIETIPTGIPIGQRDHLSRGDIEGVKALYADVAARVSEQPEVPVTISSNPDGVRLTVDGNEVVGPSTLQWMQGSQHTIAAPEFVAADGERAEFAGWSDGGELAHEVIAPSAPAMIAATYRRSYQLAVNTSEASAGAVSVEPAAEDGFHPENSTVTVSAMPAAGYCFAGWTGLIAGTPAQTSFAITGPLTVTANFERGSYSLTSKFEYAPREGGEYRIGVEANEGCAWTAQSGAPWIAIGSGETSSGSGVVSVSVEPNDTGAVRVGRVEVFGERWTVVQLPR